MARFKESYVKEKDGDMMDSEDMCAEVCADLPHLDPDHLAKVGRFVDQLTKRAAAAAEKAKKDKEGEKEVRRQET
jgi:hypothetical protein